MLISAVSVVNNNKKLINVILLYVLRGEIYFNPFYCSGTFCVNIFIDISLFKLTEYLISTSESCT